MPLPVPHRPAARRGRPRLCVLDRGSGGRRAPPPGLAVWAGACVKWRWRRRRLDAARAQSPCPPWCGSPRRSPPARGRGPKKWQHYYSRRQCGVIFGLRLTSQPGSRACSSDVPAPARDESNSPDRLAPGPPAGVCLVACPPAHSPCPQADVARAALPPCAARAGHRPRCLSPPAPRGQPSAAVHRGRYHTGRHPATPRRAPPDAPEGRRHGRRPARLGGLLKGPDQKCFRSVTGSLDQVTASD